MRIFTLDFFAAWGSKDQLIIFGMALFCSRRSSAYLKHENELLRFQQKMNVQVDESQKSRGL